MAKNGDLTDRQLRFVQEYLIDLNGTQAAIRAGYSEHTAQEQSSRLLSNVIIQQSISDSQEKIASKMGLDAEWVLREAQQQYILANNANDRSNALKALELVGKHTNIQAWKDKAETDVRFINAFAVPNKAVSANEWIASIK